MISWERTESQLCVVYPEVIMSTKMHLFFSAAFLKISYNYLFDIAFDNI